MSKHILLDSDLISNKTIPLELKGFIACIRYLDFNKIPMTNERISEITGLSNDDIKVFLKKCIELGLLEYT